MGPVPVLPGYLVKLVIPDSRAILKPAVIYRFVSLVRNIVIEDIDLMFSWGNTKFVEARERRKDSTYEKK